MERFQKNVRNAIQKILNRMKTLLILGFLLLNGPLRLCKQQNREILNIFILQVLWKRDTIFSDGGLQGWLWWAFILQRKFLLKMSSCTDLLMTRWEKR